MILSLKPLLLAQVFTLNATLLLWFDLLFTHLHRKWLRTGSGVKSLDSSVPPTGCVNELTRVVFSQIAQVRGLQTTMADCRAVFSDEFIKASQSKCVFVAALPWSATRCGSACLFYGIPQPLSSSSSSSLFILCSRMSFLQVCDVCFCSSGIWYAIKQLTTSLACIHQQSQLFTWTRGCKGKTFNGLRGACVCFVFIHL